MPELKTCKARQQSDQMVCSYCGTVWDVNDPEPPYCKLSEEDTRNLEEGEEQQ